MAKVPVRIVSSGANVAGGLGHRSLGPNDALVLESVHGAANITGGVVPMTHAEYSEAVGAADVRALTPAAWFRFGTGITVTGAGVSTWADASGNGRDLLQTTDTNRPALQTDGSILFDGADNYLICNAFTLNQPATIYVLFKQVTWTSGDMVFGGQSTSVFLRQTTGSPTLRPVAGTDTLGMNNSGLAVDTYGAVVVVFNGASSLSQVNLGTPISGDAGATNPGGFTLAATSAPTGFGHVQVKEAIIFPAAHDAAQRAQVVGYLMRVGGL